MFLKDVNTTAQKMKFFINDFFSKCDQIRKKSLMENFIFCAGYVIHAEHLALNDKNLCKTDSKTFV